MVLEGRRELPGAAGTVRSSEPDRVALVEWPGHPLPGEPVLGFRQDVTCGPAPAATPIEAREYLDSASQARARIDTYAIPPGLGEGDDFSIGVDVAGSLIVHRTPIDLQADAQVTRKTVLHAGRELDRTVGGEELHFTVANLELVDSVRLVIFPPARAQGRGVAQL